MNWENIIDQAKIATEKYLIDGIMNICIPNFFDSYVETMLELFDDEPDTKQFIEEIIEEHMDDESAEPEDILKEFLLHADMEEELCEFCEDNKDYLYRIFYGEPANFDDVKNAFLFVFGGDAEDIDFLNILINQFEIEDMIYDYVDKNVLDKIFNDYKDYPSIQLIKDFKKIREDKQMYNSSFKDDDWGF